MHESKTTPNLAILNDIKLSNDENLSKIALIKYLQILYTSFLFNNLCPFLQIKGHHQELNKVKNTFFDPCIADAPLILMLKTSN